MATARTASQGAHPRATVTPRSVIIIGGGEHARVVADAARSRPGVWELLGFSDPAGRAATAADDLPLLGDDEAVERLLAGLPMGERPSLILGFGGPLGARRRTTATFGPEVEWATVVHATAWVSRSAAIEPGVVILAGATVNPGAHAGAHAILNTHAVIEHDVRVGAGSHIAPGAIIGGGTRIGTDAMIGLGAAVRDHVVIGDRAVIGMGGVVVADVPDDATVLGVPARTRRDRDG
jgi:sugar O-acyltransferase (sialic acid O-acetyltransferase NeuD family)